MTVPSATTLLTSSDAYLRHNAAANRWQLGTSQTELALSVRNNGALILEAWRHLPSGMVMVEQPHTPLYIEIDGHDETGEFRYERFTYGTDPDDSLFVDLWLRHRQRGLLGHLFLIVYPGTSFIATFVRIQNGTPEEVHLSSLSSLHLQLGMREVTSQSTITGLRLVNHKLVADTTHTLGSGSEETTEKIIPHTTLYANKPTFYLLQLTSHKGVLGTLETEANWRAEFKEQANQLVFDASLMGFNTTLPALRGRIDSVQALIGHVTPESAEMALRDFVGKYRI